MRASQPLNWLATTAVRSACDLVGARPQAVVRHLHRVGQVHARLPNGRVMRLWSRGDDWVSNQVFWHGWQGYEPETTTVFSRLAQDARVIFDVGAYVGFYSVLAAHLNPSAAVHAFEPLPTVFKRLERNVALNRLPNVTCLNAAVGARAGMAEFYHINAELPTSSSLSHDFMKQADDLRCSQVSVISLDEFAERQGIGGVDLVKIDTETTEPEVLQGMTGILERDRPDILCEVLHGRGTGELLERALGPRGYHFYLLTPDGPQRHDHILGHPEWLNYLLSTKRLS